MFIIVTIPRCQTDLLHQLNLILNEVKHYCDKHMNLTTPEIPNNLSLIKILIVQSFPSLEEISMRDNFFNKMF